MSSLCRVVTLVAGLFGIRERADYAVLRIWSFSGDEVDLMCLGLVIGL